MPTHKRYESREVKKRSKKKYSDHDHKSRFELEEDDHFSHLFESDNHFEDESNEDAVIEQEPDAFSFIDQDSDELIWIKDSCNIDVSTVDTQVAAQVQVALQTAIGVITATLVGNVDGQVIAQELLASANLDQINKQKIIIVNSKDVTITTADTDIGVNIQAAVQTLTAVVTAILVGNVSGG
ncbi:spore coat protein X [Bacillus aryabhattai]|uniref:Spore coat protein X n=1 Tax=Priestia aryabhattai TaxID=412384 RepID=A0A7W3NFW9_PRIAR|nr:spore coat protein [Priestia aryabhattai]MBA9042278.1 spore coat protein X [Priestia aryabhattai]